MGLNDWRDELTEDFVTIPTIQAFCPLVPISDAIIEGAYQNRFIGEIEEFGLGKDLRGFVLEFGRTLTDAAFQVAVRGA